MFHAPSAFCFVKVLPGATVLFGGSFAEKCAVVGKGGVLVHPNPPIFTSFLDLSINLTNFLDLSRSIWVFLVVGEGWPKNFCRKQITKKYSTVAHSAHCYLLRSCIRSEKNPSIRVLAAACLHRDMLHVIKDPTKMAHFFL